MFAVHSLPVAVLFCVITMIGWGSWANTQKLTTRRTTATKLPVRPSGQEKWPFQLFYWDYAIGVFLFGLLFAATLGSHGTAGMSVLQNLSNAEPRFIARALLSGAIFNLGNILLVVGIDAAGMSVAFPVGVGLALVIGTVESFVEQPRGDARLLFTGVGLVVCAMVLSALAHRRLPASGGHNLARGISFSVAAGCVMGFFYPQLMRSISPDFNAAPIVPGMLTPYVALIFFGAGVLASNVVINTIFMKAGHATYSEYFRGSARLHWIGILGGFIWMIALCLNVIASGVAGPAISYALGQGSTLVAAIWGVFIWREFRGAPRGTGVYVALMFAGYTAGLVLVGMATQSVQ